MGWLFDKITLARVYDVVRTAEPLYPSGSSIPYKMAMKFLDWANLIYVIGTDFAIVIIIALIFKILIYPLLLNILYNLGLAPVFQSVIDSVFGNDEEN